jgi:hypothetical protein
VAEISATLMGLFLVGVFFYVETGFRRLAPGTREIFEPDQCREGVLVAPAGRIQQATLVAQHWCVGPSHRSLDKTDGHGRINRRAFDSTATPVEEVRDEMSAPPPRRPPRAPHRQPRLGLCVYE